MSSGIGNLVKLSGGRRRRLEELEEIGGEDEEEREDLQEEGGEDWRSTKRLEVRIKRSRTGVMAVPKNKEKCQ